MIGESVLTKVLSLLGAGRGWTTTPKTLSACPRCGTPGLKRLHFRFYETWRKAISRSRPFRCDRCRGRYWGRWASGNDSLAVLPPVLVREPVDLSTLDTR
jgi:endogenous inhibitor of DNA gyrase (YacG/DUF329 family)